MKTKDVVLIIAGVVVIVLFGPFILQFIEDLQTNSSLNNANQGT